MKKIKQDKLKSNKQDKGIKKTLFKNKAIFEFALDIIIAFVLFLLIRNYFLVPFQVSGQSMENTLYDNQYIIVNKLPYHPFLGIDLGGPKRGDIVVAVPPLVNHTFYVKRIIGMPGDTISFKNNKVILKNDEFPDGYVLDEEYTKCLLSTQADTFDEICNYYKYENQIFEVPKDHYFLMGDNRNNSTDSRDCFANCRVLNSTPFEHKDYIIGKVSFVIWPLNQIQYVPSYKYNF